MVKITVVINHKNCSLIHSIVFVTELPVASVNINPDGAPIIGMEFSVACDATFNETIADASYQWFINGSQSFRSGVSFSTDNSILTVTNVSTSDEGMYTCSVTLDIVGMEITTDTVTNETYEFATLGKMKQ